MCELTPIFRLSDCVDMFRECYDRLADRVIAADGFEGGEDDISYLSSVIDCYRLGEARETSDRRSRLHESICRQSS